MSVEDIVRRLKEDRQIAERERLQAQIEAAFAAVRTTERRRYAKPGEINPTLYGRRKDDSPQVVDAVVLRFNQMITDATDPEVEFVEPEPLEKQAAPLLASIRPVVRKKNVRCHEINEVFQGDVQKLFDEAEAALGFKKPEPKIDVLKCNIKTEKPSIWKKDIFGRIK